MVPCNEEALPKILSDIEVFGRQQISGALKVREKQGCSPTAECGLMLNPEETSGCEDTPENVAERELAMQNPPSETIENRHFYADDLKFTNWQGQKIGEITQVLDPGVDESYECVVTYTADEIPAVEVTADVNEDESNECVVTYSADEIPGVEVTAVNVSKNSSVTYPIVEIPGVDVKLMLNLQE